jgi:hypothetical protein
VVRAVAALERGACAHAQGPREHMDWTAAVAAASTEQRQQQLLLLLLLH